MKSNTFKSNIMKKNFFFSLHLFILLDCTFAIAVEVDLCLQNPNWLECIMFLLFTNKTSRLQKVF